jgi:hypothetical protein
VKIRAIKSLLRKKVFFGSVIIFEKSNNTEEEWGQLGFGFRQNAASGNYKRRGFEVSREGRFKVSFPESQPRFTSAPSISLPHCRYRPSHIEEPHTSVTAQSQDVDEHKQIQLSQPRVLIPMDSGRSNECVQLRKR